MGNLTSRVERCRPRADMTCGRPLFYAYSPTALCKPCTSLCLFGLKSDPPVAPVFWRTFTPMLVLLCLIVLELGARMGRSTQPGHPSAGRQNGYWRWLRPSPGKKRRVLRNSRPCYQDCWHTDPVRYLADFGLYASLIGFYPRRLKVLKRGWAPTRRT